MPPDADVLPDGSGSDGQVVADAGPPGEPTISQCPEFDSEIFRQDAVVVELADGRVMVAGGLIVRSPPGGGPGIGTGREEAEVFDLVRKEYVEVSPLNQGRRGASGVLLPDGKVLVTGGYGGAPGEQPILRDTAELFDPTDGTFTLLGQTMNLPRALHGSWLLSTGPHAGKVLLAGGWAPDVPELYDPTTGMFTPLGAIGAPPSVPGTPVLLADERVMFVAALASDNEYKDNYIYDAAAGTYTQIDSLQEDLSRFSASLLHDGRVLVAGGWVGAGTTALRLLDPASGDLSVSSLVLEAPRYFHSAAVLPSGRAALISGYSQTGSLTSVEIYDPTEDTLEPAAGDVSIGRAASQAVSLSTTGAIFVIGGQAIVNQSNSIIVPNIDLIGE